VLRKKADINTTYNYAWLIHFIGHCIDCSQRCP